ncbi:MAG TPA: metal ABC transporter ATP-binding protein [Edaphocola sp.]|nr:metal ABC transporter ATP-binding protein [Edaphocola sp.]
MLEIKELSVVYPGGVHAITNVNLSLSEGLVYGVIGPSGGGKSSLIKGILDLVPRKGEVTFRGRKLSDFSKSIAYVEQSDSIDRNFPITVFQCVLMGTYPNLKLFRKSGIQERKATEDAIELLGLSEYKNRQIGELSGGQFQRVLLARALAQNPLLYFMDEPFEGIDVHNESVIVKVIQELAARGKTVFIVHHGLDKVIPYFDELIMVNQKVIAHGTVEKTFTKENFYKTFHNQLPSLFKEETTTIQQN